jgi:hypothetical protein
VKKNKIIVATIALCVMLLFSCSSSDSSENVIPKDGTFEYDGGLWVSMNYKIEERTIDSCQYIIIFGVEGRSIIHKANCRNSFHACH